MTLDRRKSSADALAWALGTFLTLHAAVRLAFPEWIEASRDPEYFVRSERLLQRRRAVPPTSPPRLAVALGSSRMMHAVHGAVGERRLQAAFGGDIQFVNFGSPGGGAGRSLVYVGRLLRKGAAPDFVLVEAHPLMLSSSGAISPQVETLGRLDHEDRRWLASFGLVVPPASAAPMLWTRRASVLTALLPWATIGDRHDAWLPHLDEYGCRTDLDGAPTEARRIAGVEFARRQYQPHAPRLELSGTQFEALRGVLAECRRRGARAAVVVSSEGPIFRSWYPPGVREAARARLKSLADEYGAALVDLWDLFDEDAFVDSHHLLSSHAESFTLRMVDEAVAQWKPAATRPNGPDEVHAARGAGSSEGLR